MQPIQPTPKHELVAACLRDGIHQGRWSGSLPGVQLLAAELDVSAHTVRRSLRQLETEGVLASCGLGRSRSFASAGASGGIRRPLRVGILTHDAQATDDPTSLQEQLKIVHLLETAGNTVFLSKKSQVGLRHDLNRIARVMAKTPADAWVIESGSRELLEWCATLQTPCLALYGRSGNLPMAGAGLDKAPAYRAATRNLLKLGHRRIVLIARAARRLPTPGKCESAFLQELATHGVVTGEYNLPSWEESPIGFSNLLERLFAHSRPTALIIDEAAHYIAAAEFLARRDINVPRQVSLVSTDCDASLDWCLPGIAHMRWDNGPIIRRVARWVNAVSKGNPDRKVIKLPAEFVPGGSIGPAWKG